MSSSERPPRTADGPKGTKLRITWVKSSIGYSRRQKGTIRALGFRHLGDVVEQADTPVIWGMVDKVSHLVQVEEIQPSD